MEGKLPGRPKSEQRRADGSPASPGGQGFEAIPQALCEGLRQVSHEHQPASAGVELGGSLGSLIRGSAVCAANPSLPGSWRPFDCEGDGLRSPGPRREPGTRADQMGGGCWKWGRHVIELTRVVGVAPARENRLPPQAGLTWRPPAKYLIDRGAGQGGANDCRK